MRFPLLAAFAMLSAPAFAYDYPAPANPAGRELVERFKQERALLTSPAFFTAPTPAPAWPCNLPETLVYQMAGLHEAHPELREAFTKDMRRTMREAGMSAAMLPKTSYSNIRIVPLKAGCAAGKPDGEVQMLVAYDKRDESKVTIPFGTGVVTGTTVITTKALVRMHQVYRGGEQTQETSHYSQLVTQAETHYDNEHMEEMTRKNNESMGLNQPTMTRSITYTRPDGTIASFSETEEKQVSGGLFGVSVTPQQVLNTMLMFPVDARRRRSENYKNNQLIATGGMKDNKPHGEQVMYMDNYLKKLNLRIDQQPGMENAREVTINGVDLIEQRTCMQNGAPMKISPCPGE